MTESTPQHPWAKYYSDRGLARPVVAELVKPAAISRPRHPASVAPKKQVEVSADLAAAVAAVTAYSLAPETTAAPFVTAMQKQAIADELKRRIRVRLAKIALVAVAAVVVLHVAVTRFLYRVPSASVLQTHIQGLPASVVPLFSSVRQPLQAEGVVLTQSDPIDAKTIRYVATVTLRLRKPLYQPAVTNGTAAYRRLQEALQTAQEQDLRFNLFSGSNAPELPSLPQLLHRSHQAGETITVRVPFTARRFGWQWKLDKPQLALRTASRALEGDSLDRYAGTPYLIFGDATTLAEIRERTKLANNYVMAVSKTVQRQADVQAVVEPSQLSAAAEEITAQRVAESPINIEDKPAIDPNAPAIVLPELVKPIGIPSHAPGQ